MNRSILRVESYGFSFSSFFKTRVKYEAIEYNDEIGIFDKIRGKREKYYSGSLVLVDSYVVDEELNYFILNFKKKIPNLKFLSYIYIYSEVDKFIKYSRHQKNFFDTLGIIFSLSSTIYTIMKFIFINIYSINFDPYKIFEKIVYNHMKNKSQIPLVNISNLSKEIKPVRNSINDDVDNITLNENLVTNIDDNKEEDIVLPKLRMFHYFMNNIFSLKKCWNSNKQEIISLCKEALKKYTSIDYLMFNQMRLENLFEDYKWNNPKLKNIKKNGYISKLKNKLLFDVN